jgi:Flp pilus assembly protein TadG
MNLMHLKRLSRDTQGGSSLEVAATMPLFLMLSFGTVMVGLLMWIQLGLQHGVEMAARCASINTTLCNNATNIQNFAAQNAYGLNPPPSTFSVSTPTCGNQVSASYSFNYLTNYFFSAPSLALTAQSCYPAGQP